QGGDVLLVRTPKSSTKPVELIAPLAEIPTDCAIGQAVVDDGFAGTDNTPPFRFRRWMWAMAGRPNLEGASQRLLEQIPEYLRRKPWDNNDKNERDESFRGVLLVSGGDGDVKEGFEEVPADRAVLVTRDLQVQLADLNP